MAKSLREKFELRDAVQSLNTFEVIRAPNNFFKKRLALDLCAVMSEPTSNQSPSGYNSNHDVK